ncbi:MAG: acetyl-CoA carboxylase biotin carboxyl carrier protein [Betaproteobacteria bacterium]
MDLRKLKKLIDLVEESGITELEITEGEEKVRIVKQPQSAAQSGHAAPATVRRARSETIDLDEDDEDHDDPEFPDEKTIKASLVGTFYRSETPSMAPFVEVGSHVKAGDTLCGIEAMKQLYAIKAECAGTVKAILIENGQAVEFGTPLLIIA